MKNSRIRRRVYELLSKAATPGRTPVASQRELHFAFFLKPDRFLESDSGSGHVGSIRFEKTALKGNKSHIKLLWGDVWNLSNGGKKMEMCCHLSFCELVL